MADQASTAQTLKVTLPDLTPRKDARGGRGLLHSNEPPLPIPPPGFIRSADESETAH